MLPLTRTDTGDSRSRARTLPMTEADENLTRARALTEADHGRRTPQPRRDPDGKMRPSRSLPLPEGVIANMPNDTPQTTPGRRRYCFHHFI
jgi:hypothetical protein